jgi:UV DNA damage endonuclease
MSIGYACLAQAVPGTDIKKCLIKDAGEERLHALISHNLTSLERMVEYNIQKGILLYRISSDIIPFASSPVNRIPWSEVYADRLAVIGSKIRGSKMRVSMHPGQYTVLNSPNTQTAQNAVEELTYHALFLDSLSVDGSSKIILHIGGVYGDKGEGLACFTRRYQVLNERIKRRLVIENDDKSYTAWDALQLGLKLGIPVVFDNLHHEANPSEESDGGSDWVKACRETWRVSDGRQKIHYSQSTPERKPGAHSGSIGIDAFLAYYNGLSEPKPDVMLEVKDKNLSVLKCILCAGQGGSIGDLEGEWGRYKYLVLERSQNIYREIRGLLKDKTAYPALEFYHLIEKALALHVQVGDALNAAEHVWGYFKNITSPAQNKSIQKSMEAYASGKVNLSAVKRRLHVLAGEYREDYLLSSYYFLPQYSSETVPPEAGLQV